MKRDDEQRIIRGKLHKNRNGSPERDIAFTIAIEDFGLDEDGDAVTYPRCNPLIGASKRIKRLSPSRQAALDVLTQAGSRLAEQDYKSKVASDPALSGSDDPRSCRTIAGKAISDLVREKHITFADGFFAIRDGFGDLLNSSNAQAPTDIPPINPNNGEPHDIS